MIKKVYFGGAGMSDLTIHKDEQFISTFNTLLKIRLNGKIKHIRDSLQT
jgi:hypothetical protein